MTGAPGAATLAICLWRAVRWLGQPASPVFAHLRAQDREHRFSRNLGIDKSKHEKPGGDPIQGLMAICLHIL